MQNAPADSIGAVAPGRRTRFSDVCGTIDELKRMLHEEPEAGALHPAILESLIDDALFMEARMEGRLHEYEQFRTQITAITEQLQNLGASRRQTAIAVAPALKAQLASERPLAGAERAEAVNRAEAIRAVAQHLEDTLSRYKTLTLELARAYRAIQGNRSWMLDEEDTLETPMAREPAWARWLPPSPHRERIERYLRAGRAHLLPNDPASGEQQSEAPPLVQFEDGGVLPLPAVRWADDVRNFYPADAPPHPHGLQHCGRR
ncbi:MAG: hypothetical protein ACR2JY_00245 [Chloroflexota bacterium]